MGLVVENRGWAIQFGSAEPESARESAGSSGIKTTERELESAITTLVKEMDEAVKRVLTLEPFVVIAEMTEKVLDANKELAAERDALTKERDNAKSAYQRTAEALKQMLDINNKLHQDRDAFKERARVAEEQIARQNTCVVCSACLLPREELPHCEDCVVTDEHIPDEEREK